MLGRLALALLLAVVPVGIASAGVRVHATCAIEVSREPSHVRTLRDEVSRALASTPVTARYTLDVSLVRIATAQVGRDLEVHVEVRALLSDDQGRVKWVTSSRATARGHARDRMLIQRDAIGHAARSLAKRVGTQR